MINFIWPADETLISNKSQSGPGSNDNEEVLHILWSCRTGVSSDDLVSYLGHLLVGSFSSKAEMQSVYSTDWQPTWLGEDVCFINLDSLINWQCYPYSKWNSSTNTWIYKSEQLHKSEFLIFFIQLLLKSFLWLW